MDHPAASLPPSSLSLMPPRLAPAEAPRMAAVPPVMAVAQSPAVFTPGTPGVLPAYFNQPDQFQAAKYFTFIFFGLSCFVILLFGGFVIAHCFRRLRRRHEPNVPVVQMSGNAGSRAGEVLITVPMKEGRLVSNPDGGIEVAYIPDSPRSPVPKPPPTTPSTGDRPPASSAGDSLTDSPGASQPLPTSSGARIASGPAAASGVANPSAGVSTPRTGTSGGPAAGEAQEGPTNNERLDEYWRRRHAQMYHFF